MFVDLLNLTGMASWVLVPPAGAVVEFEWSNEAVKGLCAIAYRRLGSSNIYLEQGPF